MTSAFSAASIARLVADPRVKVEFFDTLDSSNTRAKELALAGAPEGTLVVANKQTCGKGRQGRGFASPADTGAYFTLVLRPRLASDAATLFTSYAACCLSKAIEMCTGAKPQIKWPNDVYVDGHKVSGILSEASISAATRQIDYVVVGIGVNVIEPEGGFPPEASSAGALVRTCEDANALRSRIVAETINAFMHDYDRIGQAPHLEDYRARSFLTGKRVRVIEGADELNALVLGVNDDFTLQVQLADGTTRPLSSADVHIPMQTES